MEHVGAWPWQAWLAVAQLLSLIFWRPLLSLRDWMFQSEVRRERKTAAEAQRLLDELAIKAQRISDLEDLVDLLRKALDKHLIRESAVVSAAELLIALIEQVQAPTPAMLRVRDRAVELLELARAQLNRINNGSGE